MSPTPPYTVLALPPDLPPGKEKELAERLSQAFSRPLHPDGVLSPGGFAVGESLALEQASSLLQHVLQLGAHGRIIDAKGSVLREASTPSGGSSFESSDDDLLSDEAAAGLIGDLAPGPSALAPADATDADPLDDLVFLDGSSEAKLPPQIARRQDQPARASAFAPPEDDGPLELDVARVSPKGGLQPRGSTTARPLGGQPAPEGDALDLSPLPPPLTIPATASPPPPSWPRPAAGSTVGPSTAFKAPPASSAGLDRPRTARQQKAALGAAGLALLTTGRPGRLLWGGQLRDRPRLRLLVGFVLALGLGSVLPAWHARSVVTSHIEPQREDLATARAHSAILVQFPNYRSPEAIEKTISGIRTRSSIVTWILWLVCTGGLGFLWFRYT